MCSCDNCIFKKINKNCNQTCDSVFLTKKDIFELTYIYLFHKDKQKKKLKYNEQKFNQKRWEREYTYGMSFLLCTHLFKLCALILLFLFYFFEKKNLFLRRGFFIFRGNILLLLEKVTCRQCAIWYNKYWSRCHSCFS